jgi:ribosomal protein L9
MPDGLLKAIGEFVLEVAPHPDVVASVTVTVIGEQ